MYQLKEEIAKEIKRKYKIISIAEDIGISISYMSMVLTHKRNCNKKVAYCLTKWLNKDAEISEYFERLK